MARSPLEDVADTVKDAAYVSVGLGVLAFQRLQVRRNELTRSLERRTEEARETIDVLGEALVDRMKVVEERVGAAREQLTGRPQAER